MPLHHLRVLLAAIVAQAVDAAREALGKPEAQPQPGRLFLRLG